LRKQDGCRAAKWIAPQAGRDKVYVDAAVVKATAKGAVGAVCRSKEWVFLGGSSAVVCDGITHLGTLEALACREAFDIAADLLLGPI
jgi:hypothetical protein